MKNIIFMLCIILSACVKEMSTATAPERHPGIPQDAVWAGGLDGGAWISCKSSKGKDKVYCITYFEHDGSVWSKGQYCLKKSSWNKEKEKSVCSIPQHDFKGLIYNGYDGEIIYLSDSHVLVPDGLVIFPLNKTQGSKIYYRMGKEIKTVKYGTKD